MSRTRLFLREFLTYELCWRRFKQFTMLPRRRYIENLWLASFQVKSKHLVGGSLIECGTWAGGMSFGLMRVCPELKECHFFDSFEGLPPARELDGELAIKLQQAGPFLHDNNKASYDRFLENAERWRHPDQQVATHKGWFSDTLPGFSPRRPIAVLRLDCDWYESVSIALEHLFDHVMHNGLIIIDDYYDWDGCSRALHDFLSARKAVERIRQTPKKVAYLVRHRLPA